MKKLIFIAAAIFLLPFIGMKGTPAGNPAASQSPSRAANAPAKSAGQSGYISPTPGHFPIIAWNPYYIRRTATRSDFQKLVSCGFNSALVSESFDNIYGLIPKIKGLDVSLIVNLDWFFTNRKDSLCYRVIKQLRDYVNANANPELIGGYLITDEPLKSEIADLRAFHSSIATIDSGALPWINLVGEPAEAFMQKTGARRIYSDSLNQRETFKKYLSTFCDVVNPAVLSYDFYPIMQRSADTLEINFKDFYYDLALFAHTSKARGIPFWAFCETANYIYQNPESPDIYPQRPVATEEYLRFEAFNALALGAQGIVYWAYAMQDPNENGYYQSAVVDKNGNPGPSWDAVKQINKEIKEHSDVFLGATLEGYVFIGDQYQRPSEICFIPAPAPWDKLSAARVSGKGALISRLSNKGKNYIVIVNQDPVKSSTIELSYYSKGNPPVANDTIGLPIFRDSIHSGINHIALRDSLWWHRPTTKRVTLRPSQYLIYQYPDSTES